MFTEMFYMKLQKPFYGVKLHHASPSFLYWFLGFYLDQESPHLSQASEARPTEVPGPGLSAGRGLSGAWAQPGLGRLHCRDS